MRNFTNKFSARFLIVLLTFVIGSSSVAGWLCYRKSQETKIELPNSRWEPIFFQTINRTTQLGELDELRKTKLEKDDLEVRIWRGFGLGNLEGLILKRHDHQWTALHVKADDYIQPRRAEVTTLNVPKSGWNSFWNNIEGKGILTLPEPSENNCEDDSIDGTSYVVEINQNKTYRTYRMRSEGKCDGAQQMDRIGEIIGLEFDSGKEQCKTTEWFACATLRQTQNQIKR